MKIIVLLPVKNEDWILSNSLSNFSDFADHIIIADQKSTDGSLEIYKRFPKVTVINNDAKTHTNEVRWTLLEEARKISGNNLMVCLDADEMINPEYIKIIHSRAIELKTKSPDDTFGFVLPWIQLWKSTEYYRTDSVWKDNKKSIAFTDDRKINYERTVTLNDHTSRIPKVSKIIEVPYPVLHFQYVSWEYSQIKQAWYRCNELILNRKLARRINYKYSSSLDTPNLKMEKVSEEWFSGVPFDLKDKKDLEDDWRYKEIIDNFNTYGIEYFEPLQIWHIESLKNIFLNKAGRKPKSKTYPYVFIQANKLRNWFKNIFNLK